MVNRLRGVLAALAMSASATVLTHGAAPGQQPPADPPMPVGLRDYKTVTAERLRKPGDDDWLMIRRTFVTAVVVVDDHEVVGRERLRSSATELLVDAHLELAGALETGGASARTPHSRTLSAQARGWSEIVPGHDRRAVRQPALAARGQRPRAGECLRRSRALQRESASADPGTRDPPTNVMDHSVRNGPRVRDHARAWT